MPELPEVETIRRDLNRLLKGKRIADVDVSLPKMVHPAARSFKRKARGARVENIARRGKLLLIDLDTEEALLVHLKMTGQLFYYQRSRLVAGGHGDEIPPELLEGKPSKHTHVTFVFNDGSKLYFNDLRQFGYLKLVDQRGREEALGGYGPEPASKQFTADYLYDELHRRHTSLKAVLLNQSVVAGLGNIYVDEAAYDARVRPQRKAHRITRAEAKRLHESINKIISNAIAARGTTFNNYRDAAGRVGSYYSQLKVYGRGGELCKRAKCRNKKATIKKISVAGRGTHYCTKCQV